MSYNLSDLPIRDGNRRNSQRTEPRTVLSDLPIRDGNPLPPRTAPWPSDLQTFLSGIETRSASSPAWRRPSFQTFLSGMETRIVDVVVHGEVILSDLPIRDGNRQAVIRPSCPPAFQTFLSGMETAQGFCQLYRNIDLSDLPIRDGNSRSRSMVLVYADLSDLPIRDGNRGDPLPRGFRARTFRPSYQGWKLAEVDLPRGSKDSFRPSYQGWKLLVGDAPGIDAAVFQTFLSGMETDPGTPRCHHLATAVRPSYQGWKHLHCADGDNRPSAFRPSYQGWKLSFIAEWKLALQPFRPSYQGWKLLTVKPTVSAWTSFQTFLSGMETALSCR